jgi:hypothetical protein
MALRNLNPTPTPAPAPESFVVRIYRRHASVPGRVAGTVEAVGGGETPFRSLRELQRILAGTAMSARPRRTP